MSGCRIVVYSEGKHDVGGRLDVEIDAADANLPALPRIVDRLIEKQAPRKYVCRSFRHLPQAIGKGKKLARKVSYARENAKGEFSAVVIVIDRDRDPNSKKIALLVEGRDALEHQGLPPCAVGTAVEAFDSWMIADPNAVEAAGGDKTRCHASPESLDGTEDTGRHAKCYAAAAFGGGDGLSSRYADVARRVRLDHLERCCPEGFAPFAKEVRERIGPAVQAGA